MFEGDFRYWYRQAQRYTSLDRQSLLSEFQYVFFKAICKYNTSVNVTDGFGRYFRVALKKHIVTLRRKEPPSQYGMKQGWEVVDPKSDIDIENVDINDLICACFIEDERSVIQLKMMGEMNESIREKTNLSEFGFKTIIRKIRSNSALVKAFSR